MSSDSCSSFQDLFTGDCEVVQPVCETVQTSCGIIEDDIDKVPGYIEFSEMKRRFRVEDYSRSDANGSFGDIFFGIDLSNSLEVAIKRIPHNKKSQKQKSRSPKEILPEFTIPWSLDSRNLCKVYAFSIDEEYFYIVMEKIQGKEAFDFFCENPKFAQKNPLTMKAILLEIANGLSILHGAGYAHRDIKLENVILTFDESGKFLRAVIIDFGFASCVSDIPLGSKQGTLHYGAPEIFKGDNQLTEKVDMWALGVFIFLSIYNHYPIDSRQKERRLAVLEITHRLLSLKALSMPVLENIQKNVNHLVRICKRCLEIEPSSRISSADLVEILASD
jgi:serine/threonine protein kinase